MFRATEYEMHMDFFPVLAANLLRGLPPFSEVERVEGTSENECAALVLVLTPQGMKPLLRVTLTDGSAHTAWAEGLGRRWCSDPWFSDNYYHWEAIQKGLADRVGDICEIVWACQP